MGTTIKRRLEDGYEPIPKKVKSGMRKTKLFTDKILVESKQYSDEVTKKLNNLKNIIKEIKPEESGDNIYKCNICGREFPFKSHLKRHLRYHKTLKRPTECIVCGMNFLRNDEGLRRSHRQNPETLWTECCYRTLQKYVFQRSLLKSKPK
ncbi:unnamed protein product [Meganyctiphanes norvegica]|uniref:C2H2-type domain-containing protein n=1 Tax=Meganyctiphanes norvegica TaxID=48144 RepID=A0AAV2S3C6_MEGNR